MNRRELIAAAATVVAVGSGISAATEEKPEFQVIDDRLSGSISYLSLKDGECAYCSDGVILVSKVDKILYFCPGASHGNVTKSGYAYNECWVGKKNNLWLIRPGKRSMEEPFTWFDRPDLDIWLQRPAMLAFNMAYPLDTKKGDYFVVPYEWKDRQKHPLVKRNVEMLRCALQTRKTLREVHGVHANFGHHFTFDEQRIKLIFGDEAESLI